MARRQREIVVRGSGAPGKARHKHHARIGHAFHAALEKAAASEAQWRALRDSEKLLLSLEDSSRVTIFPGTALRDIGRPSEVEVSYASRDLALGHGRADSWARWMQRKCILDAILAGRDVPSPNPYRPADEIIVDWKLHFETPIERSRYTGSDQWRLYLSARRQAAGMTYVVFRLQAQDGERSAPRVFRITGRQLFHRLRRTGDQALAAKAAWQQIASQPRGRQRKSSSGKR